MFLTFEHPPPTLDIAQKKFSKLFKDLIDSCLKKDPTKRPSAAQLLKHKAFAKVKSDIVKPKLLDNAMSLHERMDFIKKKQAQEEQERLKKQKLSQDSMDIPTNKHSSLHTDSFATTNSFARHNSFLSSSVPMTTTHILSSETEGSDMDEHYASQTSTTGTQRKPMSGWYFKTDAASHISPPLDTQSLPNSILSSPVSAPSSPQHSVAPIPTLPSEMIQHPLVPMMNNATNTTTNTATTTTTTTSETKKVITKGRFTVTEDVDDNKPASNMATTTETEPVVANTNSSQHDVEHGTTTATEQLSTNNTTPEHGAITSGDTLEPKQATTNKKRRVFNVSDVIIPENDLSTLQQLGTEEGQTPVSATVANVAGNDPAIFDSLSGKRKRKSTRQFFVKDVDDLSKLPPPKNPQEQVALPAAAILQPVREKTYRKQQQPTNMEKHLSQLVHQGQKQLNILNALFQSSKNHDNGLQQTARGEHADVFSTMGGLDKRVRQIVDENVTLKQENESLKMEIARLQQLLNKGDVKEEDEHIHQHE